MIVSMYDCMYVYASLSGAIQLNCVIVSVYTYVVVLQRDNQYQDMILLIVISAYLYDTMMTMRIMNDDDNDDDGDDDSNDDNDDDAG